MNRFNFFFLFHCAQLRKYHFVCCVISVITVENFERRLHGNCRKVEFNNASVIFFLKRNLNIFNDDLFLGRLVAFTGVLRCIFCTVKSSLLLVNVNDFS